MSSKLNGAVLRLTNLSKSFGGLKAVSNLSMAVEQGQCFGLIGPNGAGKTTVMNLITGYLDPTGGSVEFDGQVVTRLNPAQRAHRGIGRTFQIVQPFPEMSVLDNVMTSALFSRNGRSRSMRQARDFCHDPLARVGLAGRTDVLAGHLTLGEKKRLELARVLATEPKLILLDEVMGGLSSGEVESIVSVLSDIKQSRSVTIVLVEHLVDVISHLADHVFVLNFGRELYQGKPEDVLSHADVIEAYLGKPLD